MPVVLMSCAATLDGFLDDAGPERLVLSSPEDLDAVDALRAASDAILVGAGTVRADNPRLTVRSEVRSAARRLAGRSASPLRVVVARSGGLDPTAHVLSDPSTPTRVYGKRDVQDALGPHSAAHLRVSGAPRGGLGAVLADLAQYGCERVMVEAGQAISTTILRSGLADLVRIAVAPVAVGRSAAPRLAGGLKGRVALRPDLHLDAVGVTGETAILLYWNGRTGKQLDARDRGCGTMVFPPRSDPEWLAEAIELARRCPPSDSAFAVGAWIVGADGRPVASGYSRELDDKVHAEEAALRKAATDGLNVEGAVLYSSMEPCSVRLSGRPSCCEHIRRAGIGRVVYAQSEPPLFVRCQGKAQLLDAGVQVSEIGELAQFAAALSAPAGISRA